MRIKIIRCSNEDYWYDNKWGNEYDVIRLFEEKDYNEYEVEKSEAEIGDYIIKEDGKNKTIRVVDPSDAEVIFSGTESTRYEPVNDFKENIIPTIVNHPSHYNKGKIEVIDFIEDQELGFNLGNAVKYISRAGKKNEGTYIQDLEKAVWYLNREIGGNNK